MAGETPSPSIAKRGCTACSAHSGGTGFCVAFSLCGRTLFCAARIVKTIRKAGDPIFTFAVVTVSTRGFSGEREDQSGPLIQAMLREHGKVVELAVVPDDRRLIGAVLIRLADRQKVDAIFTTGGTGFAESDVTPEATTAVVSRLVPGIPEAMRHKSLEYTDRAMLSRAVAGIRGHTLIVNLPGSPKAAAENLEVFLPCLEHALTTLRGETVDCAVPAGENRKL